MVPVAVLAVEAGQVLQQLRQQPRVDPSFGLVLAAQWMLESAMELTHLASAAVATIEG